MLNFQQKKDSEKCNELQENGKDMECFSCSCLTCIASNINPYEKKYKELYQVVDMMLFNISTQWEDFMGQGELYDFFLKDVLEFMRVNINDKVEGTNERSKGNENKR